MRVDRAFFLSMLSSMNKADISRFLPGNILRAKISAVLQNRLFLQLMDSSVFVAEVADNDKYSAGTILTLRVKENSSGQLMVEVIDKDTGKEMLNFENASILRLNIPDTVFNKDLVAKLIKGYPSLSSETMQKVIEYINNNPKLPLEQAVFIVCNDMEESPEYIKFISELAEGAFHVSNSLRSLKTLILDNDNENFIIDLACRLNESDILDKFNIEISRLLKNTINTLNLNEERKDVKKFLIKLLISLKEKPSLILKEDYNNIVKQIKNIVKDVILAEKIAEKVILSAEKLQKDIAITPKQAKEVIIQALESLQVKIYPQNKYTETIKDLNIKKLYTNLDRFLRITEEELKTHYFATRENINQIVAGLQTSIRFFQDVLYYEVFMQIPINLNGQDSTGDIYIMKNKKGIGKIDPNDFTMFISLTTLNLGRVDTLVHVTNKNVILSFQMESNKFFSLVRKFQKKLYEGLKKYGYKLVDLKCGVIDENVNVLNAAKKADEFMKRYSKQLDIKI